ncbi:MAG: sporulation integral membrane protein YlbJ [Thermaerobacterales bacterium]
MQPGRTGTFLLALIATSLVVSMVAYPDAAFEAALKGLSLWWEVVVPALLPFFVGGQVLMGLGVVRFMGVLLEPMMRPLFNLPGVGGFVSAMGLASGYPVGAVLTARMRNEGTVTVAEGERLMSFANTADPLFMAGAVAVGMFGDARIAGTLMLSHYLGAITTGLGLRFYKPHAPISPTALNRRGFIFTRAWHALFKARHEDGRPFGKLMGDCVRDSMNTLMLVGGFIIIFAVLIEILRVAGVVSILAFFLHGLVAAVGLAPETSQGLIAGLFEITLGTQMAASAAAPWNDRLIAASIIVGWAGLSVHAQVAALIQGTGMSIRPYIIARLAHAAAAGIWTLALLQAAPGGVTWMPAFPAVMALTEGVTWGWWDTASMATWTLIRTLAIAGGAALLVGAFAAGVKVRLVRPRRPR